MTKEAMREDKEKKQRASKMIQSVGSDKNTGAANFNNLIEKINSRQRKWKVLESDSEDLDGNIKVVDDEIDIVWGGPQGAGLAESTPNQTLSFN